MFFYCTKFLQRLCSIVYQGFRLSFFVSSLAVLFLSSLSFSEIGKTIQDYLYLTTIKHFLIASNNFPFFRPISLLYNYHNNYKLKAKDIKLKSLISSDFSDKRAIRPKNEIIN